MIKLYFIITFFVLLILGGLIITYISDKKVELKDEYEGPVPEGYDEEHFRKTGITKKLGSNGETG